MSWIFATVASNIFVAAAMSCGILLISSKWKNPFVLHALWILILVKLVTPPMIFVPCLPDFTNFEVAAINSGNQQPEESKSLGTNSSDPEPAPFNRFLTRLWIQLRGVDSTNEPEGGEPRLEERPGSISESAIASSPSKRSQPIGWSRIVMPTLSGIWLLGFALSVYRTFGRWRRIRMTIHMAAYKLPEEKRLNSVVGRVSNQMGLSRTPELVGVDAVIPPLVWHGRKGPRLIVPVDLLSDLTDEQFETLVAHELAHLQSHHVWFRRFELLVKSIYWWFPPLNFVMRKLRQHEEEVCDARVVQLMPSHVKPYAHLLVDTSAYLASTKMSTKSLVLGMSNFQLLERRVSMIINNQIQTKFSMAGWLVLIGLLAGLPFSPVGFSSQGHSSGEDSIMEASVQDDDAEMEELQRKSGAQDFTEFGLKGEIYLMARELGLNDAKINEIRASLDEEFELAVNRGLAKKYAPIGFFKHVDPELQLAVWSKTEAHLTDEQIKKLDAYVKGLEKGNDLMVQLSQQVISGFLDRILGLTSAQSKQIDQLLSENWEASWRGLIFSSADYALAAEGATTMLPQKKMETILNSEQYRAFVDLESYAFDARKIIPLDPTKSEENEAIFEKLEKTCDRIMRLKIEELNNECQLNAKQVNKLGIAAKGSVSNLMIRFRSVLESSEDHNSSLTEPKYFSLVIEPLVVQCSCEEVWVKAFDNTLSDEQKATFEEKVARRVKAEKSLWCHYVMLYFNRARMFKFSTQVAAAEMLMDNVEYSREGDAMYNLLAAASKVPEEKWKQVIPEVEWPVFSRVLEELQRIAPVAQPGGGE